MYSLVSDILSIKLAFNHMIVFLFILKKIMKYSYDKNSILGYKQHIM